MARKATKNKSTGAPAEASLTDRAYGALEELIVTLKLAPGSAVSEAELSERLGIGRTPIREALARVKSEIAGVPDHPGHRLCGFLTEFLDVAKKGRIQEAHRTPVVTTPTATAGASPA